MEEIAAKRGTETVAAICPGLIYPLPPSRSPTCFYMQPRATAVLTAAQVSAGSSSDHR